MKRLSAMIIAVALSPAAGCATDSAATGSPAVIVHPDAGSRAELLRVVRQALGGAPLELAPDALTSSNRLTMEHGRPRDSAGQLFNGRELTHPETFELQRQGSRCVLIHATSGRAWILRRTQCAVPTAPTSP